jgi:hypothetical protein
MKPPSKSPVDIANKSGFPFQLALEREINGNTHLHRWQVTSIEHAWKSDTASGFADLVVEKGAMTLVIEAKRRDSTWVFLATNSQMESEVTMHIDRPARFGTNAGRRREQVHCDPPSLQASFCAIENSGDRAMIEDTAASALTAAGAIFDAECPPSNVFQVPTCFGVIVTTARLVVCMVDTAKIDLTNGHLPEDTPTEVVPWIRFRKQLAYSQPSQPVSRRELARAREVSIFVVSGENITQFLTKFCIKSI